MMDEGNSGRRRAPGSGGNRKGRRESFGSIRLLPSGRYQARYVGPDRREHKAPRTFTRKGEARAWLVREEASVITHSWQAPGPRRGASLTFGSYAQGWLEGRHELRPATVTKYRTALDRHLLPTFGQVPLEAITSEDVRVWFASYGSRTPTARAHAYSVLSAVLAAAEVEGLVAVSPARIRAGGRARVKREPEVLTLQELVALADAMPQRHRALTLVCGLLGLRLGEALALRRRDLNLAAGTLTVARTVVRQGGQMTTNEPKTAAGMRTVALPGFLVQVLAEHLESLPLRDRDDLVFPAPDGSLQAHSSIYGNSERVIQRNGRRSVRSAYGFLAARETIGRPELRWHDLRRTAATMAAEGGATVREVQARLGHATPTMALRYQIASAERDRAISDRIQTHLERLVSSSQAMPSQD